MKFNSDRATVLKQLISATAKDPKDQENWIRQLIDGLTSAVQTGAYEGGLDQLKLLETQLKSQLKAGSPLASYIGYRRMLAEYSVAVQTAKTSAAQAKAQEEWIKDLQGFVETHPKAEDAPDAMIQLATGLEFAGKAGEARKWFAQLAEDHPKTTAGRKAVGAMTRLDVKGKPLPLAFAGLDGGKVDIRNYRDKAVLVVFWATWCKPCFEDLPKLKALYQQYRTQGFEVIGVNLDNTPNGVKGYMQQNGMTWPQIHEAGGLESPPSLAFGVISLPTMFLVDKKGNVHSRPASIEDVKAAAGSSRVEDVDGDKVNLVDGGSPPPSGVTPSCVIRDSDRRLERCRARELCECVGARQSGFTSQQSRRFCGDIDSPCRASQSQQPSLSGLPEMRDDHASAGRFRFFHAQHQHRREQSQQQADRKQHMKVRDADRQKRKIPAGQRTQQKPDPIEVAPPTMPAIAVPAAMYMARFSDGE